MYLVTGATGTVGGHALDQLVAGGHNVRVIVRDPTRLDRRDVEVVQGDLLNADDVARALDGVDGAFLNMADDDGTVFARVAGQLGTPRVALLSSFTAVTPLVLGDANIVTARHRKGEQALTDANVPTTFLRAAGFDHNILLWAGAMSSGLIRAPYLDVALPIVDPADIAASAVAALTAPTQPLGPYSITGPEKLTVHEQAAVLSAVLGREIRGEQLPLDEAKAIAFPAGTPDFVTDSVMGTMASEASILEVSDDVERLTGRAPRTFQQWAEEHRTAFPL
jgi:(4-alkanoyl-5-oxo-2,5-dihydrofuran-3-yl)methyl phosphate reductase